MNSHEDRPQDDSPEPDQPPVSEGPQAPADEAPTQPLGGDRGPRRLTRSRRHRMLGGVCAGVARYFDIDPVIVRVITVAAAFFGGAGILLYLAALLLVPDDQGHVAADASSTRGKVLIGVAGVLLFVAVASAVPWGWGNWFLGGVVVPIAVLALLGLGAWRLVQGRNGDTDLGESAKVVRSVLLVFVLLAGCVVLAAASGWASAVGGDEVVAGLVIAAGVMLAVGAFVGRVRWLILPALAVALPLALVSAAGIEADSSVGEREYRPATVSELRDHYKLGMGSLVVDLRDADLPPGDHRLKLKVGIGEALLVVPDDVCVASAASVGLGAVDVFDRDSGGADVEWEDKREGPTGTARVVVDADVGIGVFEVEHDRSGHGHGRDFFDNPGPDRNGCVGDRA